MVNCQILNLDFWDLIDNDMLGRSFHEFSPAAQLTSSAASWINTMKCLTPHTVLTRRSYSNSSWYYQSTFPPHHGNCNTNFDLFHNFLHLHVSCVNISLCLVTLPENLLPINVMLLHLPVWYSCNSWAVHRHYTSRQLGRSSHHGHQNQRPGIEDSMESKIRQKM